MYPVPDLIDNEKHKMAELLKSPLAQSENPRLDAVTAFFNLKGFEAIDPEIQKSPDYAHFWVRNGTRQLWSVNAYSPSSRMHRRRPKSLLRTSLGGEAF